MASPQITPSPAGPAAPGHTFITNVAHPETPDYTKALINHFTQGTRFGPQAPTAVQIDAMPPQAHQSLLQGFLGQLKQFDPRTPAGALNLATIFMGPKTKAQGEFLNAIHESSHGNAVGLGDFQPSVEDLARHIGGPMSNPGGRPITGWGMAYSPLTQQRISGEYAPSWLSADAMGTRRSRSGLNNSEGGYGYTYGLSPGEMENIFAEHGVKEWVNALIEHFRGTHEGGLKKGTENN